MSYVVVALLLTPLPDATVPPPVPAVRLAHASPALGVIPPNASRVTATVVDQKTWAPGTLRGSGPPVRPGVTLYSLTIAVQTSVPARPDVPSVADPGTTLEVFSMTPFAADLVGRTIVATVEERGDTRAGRWWISDIELWGARH